MSNPTNNLRHVWREINDGNRVRKVLAVQQWREAEGWEHFDIVNNGGYWDDLEISTEEPKERP